MKQERVPPRLAVLIVKLASVGEFKDDWVEEYFAGRYEANLVEWTENYGDEKGAKYADYWAYWHASKTLFITGWKLVTAVLIFYLKFVGM